MQAIKQSVKPSTPVNTPEDPELLENETEEEPDKIINENTDLSIDDTQDDGANRNEVENLSEKHLEINEQNGIAESTEIEESAAVECLQKISLSESLPTVIRPKILPPLRISDERPWSEGDANVYKETPVRSILK